MAGKVSLRDLKIELMSPSAEPISTFDLQQCFPTKWSVDTNEKGLTEETVVVNCETVQLVR